MMLGMVVDPTLTSVSPQGAVSADRGAAVPGCGRGVTSHADVPLQLLRTRPLCRSCLAPRKAHSPPHAAKGSATW